MTPIADGSARPFQRTRRGEIGKIDRGNDHQYHGRNEQDVRVFPVSGKRVVQLRQRPDFKMGSRRVFSAPRFFDECRKLRL
ncbi:MAG: hypothetical protein L0Z51_05550 [Candidatus Latescibacteria bacterium]|nr:hypothetical protein [Candidatus Latescibacterota bacterium]